MVRGLRSIMGDDSKVAYRHAKHLDSLLTVLKDSPYARFVKWQRIRSCLTDGQDEKGNDVLEGPGGPEVAARLRALADDLLANAAKAKEKSPRSRDALAKEESPLTRDALTMKGIALLVHGDKANARKICNELEARFARTVGMRRLRQWAF